MFDKIYKLFIPFFLKRNNRSKIRCFMKGFQILQDRDQLDMINRIKDNFNKTQLDCTLDKSSPLIFGAGLHFSELILRQFLLAKIGGLDFNKNLLIALNNSEREIIHPLPPEWRIIMEKCGFRADTFRNKLEWIKFILFYLLSGYVSIAIRFFLSLKESIFSTIKIEGNYAYFQSLGTANLPTTSNDGRCSHDIITWYYKWPNRFPSISGIYHSVKTKIPTQIEQVPITSIGSAIPPITNGFVLLRYLFWGIGASFLSFIDVFRSRYWHALLLREASKSAQIRLLAPEKLARDYMFHNSNHILRPLWTYDAEKMGSRILFYFYSTNCETFKTKTGYPLQEHTWEAMNWSNYLVWDNYQADFIRRSVGEGHVNIEVVGPIWFSSSNKELPSFDKKNIITVFDVQPMRDSFYQTLGQSNGFYTPFTTNQFLIDIAEATKKLDIGVVLKRKRNIGNLVHRKYFNLVQRLNKSEHFMSADPDIDVIRLIENSRAVISMPCTSTAIIARELGKPSIYYDPNFQMQKDDRAAHGIPIVNGREELDHWLRMVKKLKAN